MSERELFVLRHAKSDWSSGNRDHDRPLKRRGIEAAETIGRLLRDADLRPDRILSSTAVRARTTAELAVEAGDLGLEVEIDDRLYEATLETWLGVVRATDDRCQRLLVSGHQPTCSEVIEHLTGAVVEFPTAALARIVVGSTWRRLGPRTTRLSWLVTPRLIQAAKRSTPT